MKINKERNEIILTYEELKKVFVNHDMEEVIDEKIQEEYVYHWQNNYCQDNIVETALEYAWEEYKFIDNIHLKYPEFEDYGYPGSSIWLCNSECIYIDGLNIEEWLDKPFINAGEVKEMFKYVERCINEAVFDYYDIREDFEDDYKNKCKYIVSLDTMELLVDGCSFVMNFEFEDLSEDIKKLIKPVEKTYTYTKVEYELLGGR